MISSADISYEDFWRRLRWMKRMEWVAWLGYLPIGGLGVLLNSALGSDIPFAILVSGWILFFFYAMLRRLFCRCPRCGKFFFWRSIPKHSHKEECVHCGLRPNLDHSLQLKTKEESQ